MDNEKYTNNEMIPLSHSPIVKIAALMLTASSLAWALDLYSRLFNLVIYQEQFLAAVYGLVLFIAFITLPARPDKTPSKNTIPWYDIVLAVIAFAASSYVAWKYSVLSELIAQRPLDGMITATIVFFLTLEALRRSAGMSVTIIIFIFVIYGFVAHLVPGAFEGFYNAWDRLIYYLTWDSGGLLGDPIMIAITIMIPYVYFGQILFHGGGGEFFSDISIALMGRFRGGSAKITVLSSAFFGTISGNVVANVVSSGVITIPMMRASGYPRHYAAAIEAVSSTGGQFMPPMMGASAFMMAEFLQIPYSAIISAALIPATLYFLAIFIVSDLDAGKLGIARIKDEDIPRVLTVLKKGWHYPFSLVVLIVALLKYNVSPEEAVIWGLSFLIPSSMLFGYGAITLKLRDLYVGAIEAGLMVIGIIIITGAVGFLIAIINISGLGQALTEILIKLAGHSIFSVLLMAALCSIVLGLGMPTVAVYGLLAVLITPALIDVGINPMGAHLFIIYFGMMSMITPPIAIASYAAATIAEADNMKTCWSSIRLGWTAYITPFMFVFNPQLLMLEGSITEIIMSFITAAGAIWFLSAAIVGYTIYRHSIAERCMFFMTGALMLLDIFTNEQTIIKFIAFIAGGLLIYYTWYNHKHRKIAD